MLWDALGQRPFFLRTVSHVEETESQGRGRHRDEDGIGTGMALGRGRHGDWTATLKGW